MAKLIAQPSSKRSFVGLSNNQLKIIAMLSMLVDHIGVELYPTLKFLRILGRLALPLFAYMIAEGCFYTKSRTRYLILLSTLAVLCQVVFYITTESLYQGILITFSLSVITIFSFDNILKSENLFKILLGLIGLTFALYVALFMPIRYESEGFKIDYGALGMFMPVAIYYAPTKIIKLIACAFMLVFLGIALQGVQFYALLALPLLALYNGQRGTPKLKYVFYVFYPLHLIAIYLASIMLF
ncbi:MAG: hypothetical protein E7353_01825 [Clostridiales bacterium]|nr:hypothetical protein [Clostridiales bacterium]